MATGHYAKTTFGPYLEQYNPNISENNANFNKLILINKLVIYFRSKTAIGQGQKKGSNILFMSNITRKFTKSNVSSW